MANIKSAKKRARQEQVRKQRNLARKTSIKTAVKKLMTSLERGDSVETVKELFVQAQSKLARAKNKGLLHANTVARKIGRLSKRVQAHQTAQ